VPGLSPTVCARTAPPLHADPREADALIAEKLAPDVLDRYRCKRRVGGSLHTLDVCPCKCHRTSVSGIHRYRFAVPWQVASFSDKGRLGVVFQCQTYGETTDSNTVVRAKSGAFVDWGLLLQELRQGQCPIARLLPDDSERWHKLMHTLYETRRIIGSLDLPTREQWVQARP